MDESYKIKHAGNVYDELREIPENVAKEIMKGIKNLGRFPFLGKELESKIWTGHQLVIEGYRVFYTISKRSKTLTVYHIRHGKRFFN
jgi:mRNA-degrading endonuclease RelE of RelBE toxin-antitoxin system